MTRGVLLAGVLFVVAGLVGVGCKDDSGNGVGNPGTAGRTGAGGGGAGSGGSAGSGGAPAGGSGGSTPGFMSILPCPSESDYLTGPTTVAFGVTGLSYDPKCLAVAAGSTVTFTGDFLTHPLGASTMRGTLTGNPITLTTSGLDGGTMQSFTFPTPGFYAYFCLEHDDDSGNNMAGVIWVK